MAIQIRRGDYLNFDPQKIKELETRLDNLEKLLSRLNII